MSNKIISIIVPVYNSEGYLDKMLNAIIKQTYVHWELILINDGSTDNSLSIIQQFVNRDNRIRSYSMSNSGPSIARNVGIEEAKGDYLTFIDADDYISPDYLDKLIQPMLTNETDLVCSGYYEVNPKFPQGLKLHDFHEKHFRQNINRKTYQSNLFTGVSGVLWGKLFKREIFQRNNIQLHPKLRLSEDLLAVLEYSRFINKAFIIPDAIYYYNRLDDGGLSGRLTVEKYKNLNLFLSELDKFTDELNFLDLDKIKNKRKYSFMIQLLKDNSYSKKEFYKIAHFLVKNESPLNLDIFQKNKLNRFILSNLFKGYFYLTWVVLKYYLYLKEIKNN